MTPGKALLHPIALASLVLLVANDRFFKAEYASAWTGKLSDCAGLVVFPLLLTALWEWGAWLLKSRSPRTMLPTEVCIGFTGLCFSAINVSDAAAAFYVQAVDWLWRPLAGTPLSLGGVHHTLDPTDLFALPFLGLAWWVSQRVKSHRPPREGLTRGRRLSSRWRPNRLRAGRRSSDSRQGRLRSSACPGATD